jgi:site-specific recombinase XerC
VLVNEHLAHLERRNLAASTINQRRRALARLGDVDLLGLTTADLARALDARALSPEARRQEIMHWHGFYSWAVKQGLLDADPTDGLERPKVPRRVPRPMPDRDKDRALTHAPMPERAMLYLAAYAGLRACEIAGLRAEHLWWPDRLIYIANGKGGKSAVVPMSALLASVLSTCGLPSEGWLFTKRDGDPMPAHLVSHRCNRYLHSIGITSTLHSLRHWFGTNFLRASGGDLRRTQEAMRHASPATTAGYTLITQAEIAETIDRLPQVTVGGSASSTGTYAPPTVYASRVGS